MREKLAKFLHNQVWSFWTRRLFNVSTVLRGDSGKIVAIIIPAESLQQLEYWMNTFYENLSDEDKQRALMEADKILELINNG